MSVTQQQKFHTDDATSVQNLVYEQQTKDKRLQTLKANVMNLAQNSQYLWNIEVPK